MTKADQEQCFSFLLKRKIPVLKFELELEDTDMKYHVIINTSYQQKVKQLINKKFPNIKVNFTTYNTQAIEDISKMYSPLDEFSSPLFF